jgi:transcriptional regulator with XRE-family HTH domain
MSALAEGVGMPRPTLVKILNGDGDVGAARLQAICGALELSLDYVLTGAASVGDALPIPVWDGVQEDGEIAFPKAWLADLGDVANLRLFRVRDGDMEPKFAHRDWVLVDMSQRGPGDGYYVVRQLGKLTTRRICFFDAQIAARHALEKLEGKTFGYDQLGKENGLMLLGRIVWCGRFIP